MFGLFTLMPHWVRPAHGCETGTVPWRPPKAPAVRNHRLDPYRHRAARFSQDPGSIGTFYVQPDVLSTVVGGHLWWQRWSTPEEFVILWIQTPDHRDTDTWVLPDDLGTEIDDWDQGRFRWVGETYQLTWLDDASTRAIRGTL